MTRIEWEEWNGNTYVEWIDLEKVFRISTHGIGSSHINGEVLGERYVAAVARAMGIRVSVTGRELAEDEQL